MISKRAASATSAVQNRRPVHRFKSGEVLARQYAAIEEAQSVAKVGTVRWSYAVAKGRGAKSRQSGAEAIAKPFKSSNSTVYCRRLDGKIGNSVQDLTLLR
jgi:hypothetical protein